MTAASVPTGTKRCCEIQGQERHQGNPAELTPKRYPNTTNRQGVNQVLNYRDKLTKEYYSLCHQSSEPFEVLSPKCVVIIGKMASLTPGQVAAFENFRNSLSNVLILTFDELYQRIVDLIAVLSESPNQQPGIFEPETGNEDLPF